MDRLKTFSVFVVSVCFLSPASHAATESDTNRYNVLFIAIDDLRPELGCYNVTHAQSPFLDQLAQKALVFDRHYVQVATCGASRYCLLTGRAPHATGITKGNDHFYAGKNKLKDRQLEGAQTMPELFRRGGYRTSLIGKISHTADGRVYAYNGEGDGRLEMPQAWNDLLTPLGSWKRGWGVFFAYADGKHREDGGGHKDLWQFTAKNDDDLPDGLNATAAIKQLQKYKENDERFFMGLGFYKPHLPFVAPKQDWEAFEDVEIPLPPKGRIDSRYWHKSGEFYKYNVSHEKTYPLSDDAIRNSKRAYSACVRYVDRQVGRVLKTLDELELSRETIVVVWGDHGWHLGEQELWAKHAPFERTTRSALLIYVPGMTTAGEVTESLAATIDLYPTLVELCNPAFRKVQYALDGKSLVPVLRHQRSKVREVVRSYWKDAVTVRTDSHRLVARMKNGEPTVFELYDVSSDPDTMRNLGQTKPALRSKLAKMLVE